MRGEGSRDQPSDGPIREGLHRRRRRARDGAVRGPV